MVCIKARRMRFMTGVLMLFNSLIQVSYCCTKLSFWLHADQRYVNGGLVRYSGAVSVSDCIRACRLTPRCSGFNMEWAWPGSGYCELFHVTVGVNVMADSSYTRYSGCPFPISMGSPDRCMLLVRARRSWFEAQDYCRDLYPEAHLAELYTEQDLNIFTEATKVPTECTYSKAGTEYLGHVNQTVTGRTCQRWDAHTPHPHEVMNSDLAWILEGNYCRNPDGEPGVWCYTLDPSKRWELCDVPLCAGKSLEADTSQPSVGLWLGSSRTWSKSLTWGTSSRLVDTSAPSWASGEPARPGTGKHCLSTFRGEWIMAVCTHLKEFVCEL